MISQELIAKIVEEGSVPSQIDLNKVHIVPGIYMEEPEEAPHPNVRFKAIHMKEDSFNLPCNGRLHIEFEIGEPTEQEPMIVEQNFNGVTVSYKQNKHGGISFAFVFKSHKDVYNKRIGFDMASIVLDKYLLVDDSETEQYQLGFTASYGYDAVVGVIPSEVFKMHLKETLPDHVLKTFGAADMRNSFVNSVVGGSVELILERMLNGTIGRLPEVDLA